MMLGHERSNSLENAGNELTKAGRGFCKVKQGTKSHGNMEEVSPLRHFIHILSRSVQPLLCGV